MPNLLPPILRTETTVTNYLVRTYDTFALAHRVPSQPRDRIMWVLGEFTPDLTLSYARPLGLRGDAHPRHFLPLGGFTPPSEDPALPRAASSPATLPDLSRSILLQFAASMERNSHTHQSSGSLSADNVDFAVEAGGAFAHSQNIQ